jgi:integrase
MKGSIRVPSGPQANPSKNHWKVAFLEELAKVCQQTETVVPQHPYRKAVLRHHNYDLSKRWYVEYYAWHEEQEKLVRFRLFEPLNRMKGMNQRITTGEEMVRIINGKLTSGQFVRATSADNPVKANLRSATMTQAFNFFIEVKKSQGCRENYVKSFVRIRNSWEDWRIKSKTSDFHIQDLNEQNIEQFFAYVTRERKVTGRTYNNYVTEMRTFLKFIVKKYPRLVKKNLMDSIDTKRVTKAKKHAAYSDKQMKLIAARCTRDEQKQLLLMIHLTYYTLARPRELYALKISQIDIEENRIFIPGTISKNRNDEYIYMPPTLREEILRQGIMHYPKHFFVLGRNNEPGDQKIPKNKLTEQNAKVLKALDLTDRKYDLYSYKHSGAISLYKNTKDIVLVQHACRHSDISQTAKYLRELGLIDPGYFKLDQWAGALK